MISGARRQPPADPPAAASRAPPVRKALRVHQARHRGVPQQGALHRRLPGSGVRRRGLRGAHPRPAAALRAARHHEEGPLREVRGRRRGRLHALLRRQPRQEEDGRPAQEGPQGGRRALPGHRRRPRGRGHRLAPPAGPQAQGAGAPHGLHRDHPRGRHPGPGQHPRAGHPPRRRPGDPPHPGPPRGLRGQPGPVAQGPRRPVRRARAVSGHPPRRRARARAHGLPLRLLLGGGGHLLHRPVRRGRHRPPGGLLHRPARHPRRAARGHRPRLQRRRTAAPRRAQGLRRPPPPGGGHRRGRGHRPGRAARGRRGGQALQAPPGRPLHHLHPPAGGLPQAAHEPARDHARGAGPLRERLHHLHAYRLHGPVRSGRGRGPLAGGRALRGRVRPRAPPRLRLQVQGRPGGPRGDPPRRRPLPHPGPGLR